MEMLGTRFIADRKYDGCRVPGSGKQAPTRFTKTYALLELDRGHGTQTSVGRACQAGI